MGILARPLDTWREDDKEKLAEKIDKLCKQENITQIILGLAKSLYGTEQNIRMTHAYQLADILKEKGYIIHYIDERFSSKEAADILRNQGQKSKNYKDKKDAVAACVILQQFLDTKR